MHQDVGSTNSLFLMWLCQHHDMFSDKPECESWRQLLTIGRNNLEGRQTPVPQSVLLQRPDIRHIGSVQNTNSELYVTAQLWAESKPLGVPMQTPYKFFKTGRTWNEWLELPVLIKDCPISSQVAITIWDLSPFPESGSLDHAIPFGGTTIPLFDKDGA